MMSWWLLLVCWLDCFAALSECELDLCCGCCGKGRGEEGGRCMHVHILHELLIKYPVKRFKMIDVSIHPIRIP